MNTELSSSTETRAGAWDRAWRNAAWILGWHLPGPAKLKKHLMMQLRPLCESSKLTPASDG